jgi:hypothetical protein
MVAMRWGSLAPVDRHHLAQTLGRDEGQDDTSAVAARRCDLAANVRLIRFRFFSGWREAKARLEIASAESRRLARPSERSSIAARLTRG